MLCGQLECGGLDHRLGRTDHEAGAGEVDCGPRVCGELAGVGGAGGDELSEGTAERAWRDYCAECGGGGGGGGQYFLGGVGVLEGGGGGRGGGGGGPKDVG